MKTRSAYSVRDELRKAKQRIYTQRYRERHPERVKECDKRRREDLERQREIAKRHRENTGYRFVRKDLDAREIRRAERREAEEALRRKRARELHQLCEAPL